MPVLVYITSNLEEIATYFDRAVAEMPAIIDVETHLAAKEIASDVVPIIVTHTPKVTGDLADSTIAEIVSDGHGSLINFRQPAQSKPNQDGSGGGQFYVGWVVKGRAAITAPSGGPYSTGKLALRTPWGPRKSVKASKPNPYPQEAMAEADGPMRTVLVEHAGAIGMKVLGVMGGRT